MALQADDITTIAQFAHIQIVSSETESIAVKLNQAIQQLETMIAVNTTGIAPLINPHDAKQRLREDVANQPNQRDELLSNAPLTEQGLFLVPRVIE